MMPASLCFSSFTEVESECTSIPFLAFKMTNVISLVLVKSSSILIIFLFFVNSIKYPFNLQQLS